MDELSFRGKDRYRLSWRLMSGFVLVAVVEWLLAFTEFGATGASWLLVGTVGFGVLCALGFWLTRRSRTTVGATGITISQGLGRGRTYPWEEIRWIDVRESTTWTGTFRNARITLASGRRRTLPALQHSTLHPDPDFDVDFQRVLNWWELSTEPAARFRPPQEAWRMTPERLGVVLGVVIMLVVVLTTT